MKHFAVYQQPNAILRISYRSVSQSVNQSHAKGETLSEPWSGLQRKTPCLSLNAFPLTVCGIYGFWRKGKDLQWEEKLIEGITSWFTILWHRNLENGLSEQPV